jgi:hypothetical protein
MASRLELQSILESILGSRNVYFQPPSTIKMRYPAIVFSLSNIDVKHADDTRYLNHKRYELTYIDSDPDNENVEKILTLPLCSFDRFYTSNNLNHYVFTIYF